MISNPAWTNVVAVGAASKTIYIGEQNSNNEKGEVIGIGDFKKQTEQVYKNIHAALQSVGADWQHLIKWTIYVVEGQSVQEGFEVFKSVWGDRPNPPLLTVLFVASLGNPDYLVGMEAIAVI